jgi:DNA-binding transcriptional LysR family regulator
MDKLRSMKVFKQVVAENGFAAGARKLGLSPAQVTRWSGTWKTIWGCSFFNARRAGSR